MGRHVPAASQFIRVVGMRLDVRYHRCRRGRRRSDRGLSLRMGSHRGRSDGSGVWTLQCCTAGRAWARDGKGGAAGGMACGRSLQHGSRPHRGAAGHAAELGPPRHFNPFCALRPVGLSLPVPCAPGRAVGLTTPTGRGADPCASWGVASRLEFPAPSLSSMPARSRGGMMTMDFFLGMTATLEAAAGRALAVGASVGTASGGSAGSGGGGEAQPAGAGPSGPAAPGASGRGTAAAGCAASSSLSCSADGCGAAEGGKAAAGADAGSSSSSLSCKR